MHKNSRSDYFLANTQIDTHIYGHTRTHTHTHTQIADKVGLSAVRLMRTFFDKATGYGPNMTEAKWLQV